MKLTIFFISRTKKIHTNTSIVSKRTFKIKTMPRWTILEVSLTSAVIYKEKLQWENNIVQSLQNCDCQDSDNVHFTKPLQGSKKVIKNDYPKVTHVFFLSCLMFLLFLTLKLLHVSHFFDKINQTTIFRKKTGLNSQAIRYSDPLKIHGGSKQKENQLSKTTVFRFSIGKKTSIMRQHSNIKSDNSFKYIF